MTDDANTGDRAGSDTDVTDGEGDATADRTASSTRAQGAERRVFDRETLSDLFVNAVPIGIILAFVLLFGVASSRGPSGDPLVLFHAALIGGVLLVSYVAARAIAGADGPLAGSAADGSATERPADDD